MKVWKDILGTTRQLIDTQGFKPWERESESVVGHIGFTSAYPWYDICLGYSERDYWEDYGRWERRQRRFERVHAHTGLKLSDAGGPYL